MIYVLFCIYDLLTKYYFSYAKNIKMFCFYILYKNKKKYFANFIKKKMLIL